MVRLGNIGAAECRYSDAAYLNIDYWAALGRHHVEPGDLLVAGLGDEGNPVGRAAVAPESLGAALVKAGCYRLSLDCAHANFIAYYLSSADGLGQSWQLAEGSTRPRLTLGKALSLQVPTPPIEEQWAIAGYRDAETARMSAVPRPSRWVASTRPRTRHSRAQR